MGSSFSTLSFALSVHPSVISVAICPGATALTRIPWFASSSADPRVIIRTAPFEESYWTWSYWAKSELIDAVLITTPGSSRSILQRLSEAAEIDVDHPKHDYLAPHGGRRGMGEVLVRAFEYTVAARYLDNSEEMVRDRYSHIEAGEFGDVATEALSKIDSV
jgi:hypothetical protein